MFAITHRARRSWGVRVASVLTCGALLGGTAAVGVLSPPLAQADEVSDAQARVDSLQALVAATTVKLTEGTRSWEADLRSLSIVNLKLGNTRRHVAQAQAEADEGQEKLDAMARSLYMNGGGRQSSPLLIGQSPETFLSAVKGLQLAERAAGSTQQVIARAATSRHRLQQQEAEAKALAADAKALVEQSARRLNQLKELAQQTSDKLTAAQDALEAARTRSADAAARLRAARERASRSRVSTSGGASCSGRSTAGQQNGNLDPASLCPLWQAPGHRLRADAAAAFNQMSKYHAATVGSPLCVTDSYRSYSEQVALYQRKPGLAAVPGTSNHGWGQAVDFCGGIENTGSSAYKWMEANAGRFGWIHPEWARPSGSKPEPWHWEFGT